MTLVGEAMAALFLADLLVRTVPAAFAAAALVVVPGSSPTKATPVFRYSSPENLRPSASNSPGGNVGIRFLGNTLSVPPSAHFILTFLPTAGSTICLQTTYQLVNKLHKHINIPEGLPETGVPGICVNLRVPLEAP